MFDPIGDVLNPVGDASYSSQRVLELATDLVVAGRLKQAATRSEAKALRSAAWKVDHLTTRRRVDLAIADAAIRRALHDDESLVAAHFPEFRRLGPNRWDAAPFDLLETPASAPPAVRLRHLQIHDGRVPLTLDVLHYHAVAHLAARLPPAYLHPVAPLPGQLVFLLGTWQRQERARERRWQSLGDKAEAYPPCVKDWLHKLHRGIHLGHTIRFNLMGFLGKLGWPVDRLARLFSGPSYDAREMAYQAAHVRGSPETGSLGYAPMGCDQLRSRGLCADSTCPGPTLTATYARNRGAKPQASVGITD